VDFFLFIFSKPFVSSFDTRTSAAGDVMIGECIDLPANVSLSPDAFAGLNPDRQNSRKGCEINRLDEPTNNQTQSLKS
jgi:hypothetical protein